LTLVLLDRLSYYYGMSEEETQADEEMRELARKLGRRGGKKGGKARAEKLTPEQRSEIARKAAKARWAKKRRREEESS
jgi:hypothetical protein